MLLLDKPGPHGSPRAITSTTGGAALRAALGACATVAVLGFSAPAAACPDCAVGVQARSDVWHQGFWLHLLVALLPFVLIAAICVFIEEREQNSAARDRRDLDPEMNATPIGAVVPERARRIGS